MTCYQRHITGVFEQLGLAYDAEGRRRVHAAVLELLGLPDGTHCPEVWAGLKAGYGARAQDIEALARDVARVLEPH